MKWRNVRLAGKFGIGFGLVLLLLTFVGVWATFGIGQIVGDAGQVIKGNKLPGETVQREVSWIRPGYSDSESQCVVHARNLGGLQMLRRFFERVVWSCVEMGLVDSGKIFVDSSLVGVDASKDAWIG